MEQKNLTSSSYFQDVCRCGENSGWKLQFSGESSNNLSVFIAPASSTRNLRCRRRVEEHWGMSAHKQQAARGRRTCLVRVREREREREPSTRRRTSGGARSRELEGSFGRRRAVLGHSVVDRSTCRKPHLLANSYSTRTSTLSS